MANYVLIFFSVLIAIAIGIAYFINRYSLRKCLSLRLEGIRINRLAKQLLLDLQQHRGMVNAFLSGDKSFKPKIEQKQTAIGQDMTALNAFRSQGLMTAKRWDGIVGEWQSLRTECLALPPDESIRRHSELIRAVLYSIGDIAERSQIVDMCAADFTLVNALWNKIPAVAESLGQARAIGASVAPKGRCSGIARTKLRFLEERVREIMELVGNDLAHANLAQSAALIQTWKEAQAISQEFLLLLNEKLIDAEHPTIDADHYFKECTKVIEAVFNTFDQASNAVEKNLTEITSGTHAA